MISSKNFQSWQTFLALTMPKFQNLNSKEVKTREKLVKFSAKRDGEGEYLQVGDQRY